MTKLHYVAIALTGLVAGVALVRAEDSPTPPPSVQALRSYLLINHYDRACDSTLTPGAREFLVEANGRASKADQQAAFAAAKKVVEDARDAFCTRAGSSPLVQDIAQLNRRFPPPPPPPSPPQQIK